MSRKAILAPGEYYHLYNRGTDKRKIFSNEVDRKRFLALLYLCNSNKRVHLADLLPRGLTSWNTLFSESREQTLVDICAYCLMPNHFHLIVREHTEGGISLFMQKLMTGYTMYFNTTQRRTGTLFQGSYKAEHIDTDRYLRYLISYVHLNPVKLVEPKWKEAGINNRMRAKKYLENYPWSSFAAYCGSERVENAIINPAALPRYFSAPKNFLAHVTEWLKKASSREV